MGGGPRIGLWPEALGPGEVGQAAGRGGAAQSGGDGSAGLWGEWRWLWRLAAPPPPRIGVLSERGEVLGRPVGAEVLRALQKAQNPKNTIQIACKFLRELPGMYTLLFHLLWETILTV